MLSLHQLFIIGSSLVMLWLCPPAAAATFQGVVTRVMDGDTVLLEVAGQAERVRLAGVDTPELSQLPWGPRARDFTARLVLHRPVRVETDVQVRDRYRRLLGYLYAGKVFVNLELVRQGLAMLYTAPPNVAHASELLAAQRAARAASRNIWSVEDGLTLTPYEFRHPGRTPPPDLGQSGLPAKMISEPATELFVIGNRKSGKYHLSNCPLARRISPANRWQFANPNEAEQAGLQPCHTCRPLEHAAQLNN